MTSPTPLDGWTDLHNQIKHATVLYPNTRRSIVLWYCASLTFISGMLYALSFFRRRSAGTWIFRKDNQGYWHPNVHTAIPIFAVLYAACDICAIFLFERNVGHGIDPLPSLLIMFSGQSLQVIAWLKVWAVLYALPSSRPYFDKSNTLRVRNLVSPMTFNALNILIILAIPAGQLPWMVATYLSTKQVGIKIARTDLLLQKVSEVSSDEQYSVIYEAALKAFVSIIGIKREGLKVSGFVHKYVITNIVWTCFVAAVYLTSSGYLVYSLYAQNKFLASALGNRKAIQLLEEQEWTTNYSHSITSWILESAPSSPTCTEQVIIGKNYQHKDTNINPWAWKSWIEFANYEDRDEDVSWKNVNKLQKQKQPISPSIQKNQTATTATRHSSMNDDNEVAELEGDCKFLSIYMYSTLGQMVLGMGMIISYVTLQFWLIFRTSSARDDMITTFTWINWTWGGGAGLLLGIVACVVAYSTPKHLASDSKLDRSAIPKNPTIKVEKISSSRSRDKSKEANSIKLISLPATRRLHEPKAMEAGTNPVVKRQDYAENWMISNLDLSRSSSKTSATVQNGSDLSRQDSSSSVYSSIYAQATDHTPYEKNKWNEPDGTEIEDLDTEQWDTGHFNAIHALRRGTFRETRFSGRKC